MRPRRRRMIVGSVVALLALALVASPCSIVGRGDGFHEVRLRFDPPPSSDWKVSWFLLSARHVARVVPSLESGPRTHPEMRRLEVAADGSAYLRVPFSTVDCGCYGLRRSTRIVPFDTVFLEYRDVDGRRVFQTTPLPAFDSPPHLTIALPPEVIPADRATDPPNVLSRP